MCVCVCASRDRKTVFVDFFFYLHPDCLLAACSHLVKNVARALRFNQARIQESGRDVDRDLWGWGGPLVRTQVGILVGILVCPPAESFQFTWLPVGGKES